MKTVQRTHIEEVIMPDLDTMLDEIYNKDEDDLRKLIRSLQDKYRR